MMKPYNEEDSNVARKRAIQAIYFDNTLSPKEKHERLLALQGLQDSDSDNMSIFTEGTGVQSPRGSVGSNSRGPNTTASTSSRRKSNTSMSIMSQNSNKSSKSTMTTTSKRSSKNTRTNKSHWSAVMGAGASKQEAPKPSSSAVVAQHHSSSLSVYDAFMNDSQKDEFLQHIAPPMEDVESVIPNEEQQEGEMKDIPLDDEQHELLEKSVLEEFNKTKSNETKTQGSDTEPAYSLTSMNSSIDTHEQNPKGMEEARLDVTSVAARSFSYRKRRACTFFCCSLLLLVVVIAPMAYFFRTWIADKVNSSDEEDDDVAPSMDSLETSSPTSSPTKEFFYDPPTAKDCLDIADGNMKLKDGWILRRFQVPMDVDLQYETSDVDTMTDMLVSHLQSDLAPVLAGCTEIVGTASLRRRLDTTRFVIGNAIMSAWHESDDVCATQKSTCYRVMVSMSLYVQGMKTNNPLQDIVTEALDAGEESLAVQLGLPSPFEDVKVRGVYPTFTTESPTGRPTTPPSLPPIPPPTTAPVASPTPNPTVQASGQPTVAPNPRPTNPPTPPPTDDCKSNLQEVLRNNGVTQLNDNAFAWMSVDQWRCNGNENSIVDRYALASLYITLGGENWLRKIQWLSAESVCDWQGVSCDSNSVAVTSLDLGGNQLSGALPVELALLTKLTSLVLDTNGLGSSILPELANLVELVNLNLSNNAFTGQVPDTFANLVNLESLKVDSNQMQGRLTTQIGRMAKLSELSLSANQLSGDIPTEIGMLSVLEKLNLSTNQFSSMPAEISQLISLKSLQISSNKLKGDIPDFQGLAQLTLLRLDNNKLSGDIPKMPTSLSTCNLTSNKFKNNNKNKNDGVCILK